jgi:hypothetical protein
MEQWEEWMVSRGRRWLTYVNVMATLALVFAMTGGAYAASKYIITSSKQISPKVLKQLDGKVGAIRATGPAGPAGGKGEAGIAGQSVKSKVGKEGKEGSSWTAEDVLSAGQAETGMCGAAGLLASIDEGFVHLSSVPISYRVQLPSSLLEVSVHIVRPGAKGSDDDTCAESSSYEEPAAELGNPCIFERADSTSVGKIGVATGENGLLGTTGLVLKIKPKRKNEPIGTYDNRAVTGPTKWTWADELSLPRLSWVSRVE